MSYQKLLQAETQRIKNREAQVRERRVAEKQESEEVCSPQTETESIEAEPGTRAKSHNSQTGIKQTEIKPDTPSGSPDFQTGMKPATDTGQSSIHLESQSLDVPKHKNLYSLARPPEDF